MLIEKYTAHNETKHPCSFSHSKGSIHKHAPSLGPGNRTFKYPNADYNPNPISTH